MTVQRMTIEGRMTRRVTGTASSRAKNPTARVRIVTALRGVWDNPLQGSVRLCAPEFVAKWTISSSTGRRGVVSSRSRAVGEDLGVRDDGEGENAETDREEQDRQRGSHRLALGTDRCNHDGMAGDWLLTVGAMDG